jgi:hypothetical protein
VLAASIEWGLDPPQPGSGVAGDAYLAPLGAEVVLQAMLAHYPWLSEWINLAKGAALAEVALEVALANDAPRELQRMLTQTADQARSKLDGLNVPSGVDARQVLETFVQIQS